MIWSRRKNSFYGQFPQCDLNLSVLADLLVTVTALEPIHSGIGHTNIYEEISCLHQIVHLLGFLTISTPGHGPGSLLTIHAPSCTQKMFENAFEGSRWSSRISIKQRCVVHFFLKFLWKIWSFLCFGIRFSVLIELLAVLQAGVAAWVRAGFDGRLQYL